MTDAPHDRKMARVARDLAWGNWASKTERAMLVGPRGEVRDVFFPGDPSFLTARQALIDSGQLSAVVYLCALRLEDIIQLSIVEFFEEKKRTTHVLTTRLEDKSNWFGLNNSVVDQWIQTRYHKGEDQAEAEK
jgi:hypothetical protein